MIKFPDQTFETKPLPLQNNTRDRKKMQQLMRKKLNGVAQRRLIISKLRRKKRVGDHWSNYDLRANVRNEADSIRIYYHNPKKSQQHKLKYFETCAALAAFCREIRADKIFQYAETIAGRRIRRYKLIAKKQATAKLVKSKSPRQGSGGQLRFTF